MKSIAHAVHVAIVISLGAVFASVPALADKPSWAGKGKGNDERDDDRKGGKHEEQGNKKHFKDDDRAYVRDYYAGEFQQGKCPPGLAKKHNGCMPPGQAKKWDYGRPLPREVVYYEVPQPVVVRIGPPPSGYKYVRVASDILMIAVGTNMVVDAITDLGRM
jgi:Ni/Co efflux regulator RcnB